MRRLLPTRALAAAALAAALAAGCGRPPDEAWLLFTGFQATVLSGTTATTVPVSVLKVKLDGTNEDLFAAFENASFTVGSDDAPGIGILVSRVRVEYSLPGAPVYEYPATLYLPAPAKAGETTKGSLGVLLVPASLKQWLSANGYGAGASFGAHATFDAKTGDGNRLETSGDLLVLITT